MKQILITYTSYNLWANNKIMEVIKGISPSLLDKEINSSFPTLRKTAHHNWMAEEVWFRRLNRESLKGMPEAEKDFNNFANQFQIRSQSFIVLVNSNEESFFEKETSYTDLKGNSHTNTNWQMIMHCMNHSTYHRGQLVTILREVGETTISSTDMIGYFREKGNIIP